LFGERSVEEVESAWDKRLDERRQVWEMRVKAEVAQRQKEEDARYQGEL